MSRRLLVLLVLPTFLLFGACGSSSHKSASATLPGEPAAPGAGASTATGSSATSAAGSTGGAQRTTSTGATNARVPATFVVHPGGKVVPPVISVPAFLAIQLTVVSGDGKAHQAQLRAPGARALRVPAHGSAQILIGGLRAGHYPLVVDGRARGSLMTGGEPGP